MDDCWSDTTVYLTSRIVVDRPSLIEIEDNKIISNCEAQHFEHPTKEDTSKIHLQTLLY